MLKYDAECIKKIHSMGSRRIVGYVLGELSRENKKILAAYADVGSRFDLLRTMGSQGIQISIAEQSLISILGGLCHEGMIPFGVAYAPFITMRAADQIKMCVGAMGLGMKIIGGSAGLVSGNLGAASMALDDISMMRAIPNMVILSPADNLEAAKMMEAASRSDAPFYIRLTGGKHIPVIYHHDFTFQIGRANIVFHRGTDVVIYASGIQVGAAIGAAEIMLKHGIGCTVVDMHTIKPIDEEVIDRFSNAALAVTVEEHNMIGGLGSAVAESLASGSGQRLLRIGIEDSYPAPDSYEALLYRCGLTSTQIAKKIEGTLEQK